MNGRPVTPLVAADIIIRLSDRSDSPVVFIRRKNPPYGWALPGGFVDVGESLEQAAMREAKEETGLLVVLNRLLGCYSNPKRDARGHTVSAVYIAEARGEPRAGDDAGEILLASIDNMPDILAFDHDLIMIDYLRYLGTGETAPLRL